jgi:membrane-bound lytic murein transglycosylase D
VIPSAVKALKRRIAPRSVLAISALSLLAQALCAQTPELPAEPAAPTSFASPTPAPTPSLTQPPAPAELFPRPAELQPDINFWIRVYTEISTAEGFIHDQHSLGVVYEKLKLAPDDTTKARQAQIDAVRDRYVAILKFLATGASARDADDQRVRDLWPAEADAARFAQAAADVRFQLGQSDRFRAGLVRAGAWEQHIANTIAAQGLPAELAALPHVESSFNPDAYSKVGAAGLWQFMRSTGRLYMRIDNSVDERMDPFRASEAAAQLLAYNYRVLGTWPLALTAYNHGAEGMRRARNKMGTTDIVKILREYNSPLFGFASRNFYVSFLAAQTIDRDPQKYFGNLAVDRVQKFQEVTVTSATRLSDIERAVNLPHATLRTVNPALREAVWNGSRLVPAGYKLRLPQSATNWTSTLLASRLKTSATPAASSTAVAEAAIATVAVRRPPVQPAAASKPPVATAATTAASTSMATAAITAATASVVDEPVAASPDATDLAVADNGSIVVAAAETLGHYADWLGISAAHLRTLNNMNARSSLPIGGRLKLDFNKVDRATFEQRRRAYRERVQADYFATRRISGTQNYQTRRGDSLWSVTRQAPVVPSWLLQQYNPDVDFANLRAGTTLVLPKVESLTP